MTEGFFDDIKEFFKKTNSTPVIFKDQSKSFMITFTIFKDQSERFMNIFRNFKDQSQRFNIFGITCRYKKAEMLLSASSALEKKVKHTRITTDKEKLRIILKVLEAVKENFPGTKSFIDDMMEEQCQKEKISVEEVIFLQFQKQKSCKRYFIRL